jgi:hypothetical protein
MKCTEMQTWLFRKMDGELTEPENSELDAHLSTCASCMRDYQLLVLPQRIAQAIPAVTPSPYFYGKVKTQIESETQTAAIWQIVFSLAHRFVPAMAAITLALLSVFAYFQIWGPDADVYKAYHRVFLTEDMPNQMFIADQEAITDENVLNAIAQRTGYRNSDLK